MTRWTAHSYDGFRTVEWYTFANKSAQYFPTNNCSRPLNRSNIAELLRNYVGSAHPTGLTRIGGPFTLEGFEIVHEGSVPVRLTVGEREPLVNESVGKILNPGEVWCPPFRNVPWMAFYTSSNVSQCLRITLVWCE